ncbi:hypothetical protein CHS0354_032085 [Potamilus streckersoni]|uniref:Uncharacterized protein n=1 Tax=Potamilus streckersoni TaxID=2493646 RepID=A0AAE0TMX1_9BIVA|nr:hypothetical protein CHS0354_032085 [Potamilus streckersoni]
MDVLYLRPSEIRYSQDSINNVFDGKSTHRNKLIGETLDDLCEGICCLENIPSISVMKKNGKWFSADNRRLWVFKHLERHGKCREIPVYETYFIPDRKFTTINEGESIRVRRDPGGIWYRKTDPNFQANIPTRGTFSKNETMVDNFYPTYSSKIKPAEQYSTATDRSIAKAESVIPKSPESTTLRKYLTEQHNRREYSVPSYSMGRLRIQTPVADDISLSELDICEQNDIKQTPNASVRFQTSRNLFDTKIQQGNLVPTRSTKSVPEYKHSTTNGVQIANAELKIDRMKTTVKSSYSPLTERTKSERHTRLENRYPIYSMQNPARIQTAESMYIGIREVKSKKREHEVNTSSVPVVTRPIDEPEIQAMTTTSKPSKSAPMENNSSERHRRDSKTAFSHIQTKMDEKPKRMLRRIYTLQWLMQTFPNQG